MISGNMIGCCSGTLGSLVSRGGTFYILSNNHVLDKSGQGQPGDPISQPGLGDASCRVQNTGTVAHLSQAAPLQGTPANVDAAIAEIVPGTVDINGAILDLAGANQPAPPSATLADPSSVLSSNESVAKVGRSSGLTCSTVFSVGTDVTVNYPTSCGSSTKFQVTYTNQVIINGASFSAAGDSGSLIVTADTARPVGLLFAGNGTQTIANPIQTVLSALKDPNSGETPRMVGGADHPVACPAIGQSEITPAGALSLTSQLDAGLNQRAIAARTAHMVELMQDPGVSQIVTGASDDDPSQPAIVLHVNGILQRPIPHQIEGVRTKVVFDDTGAPQPRVGAAEIVRAAQVKAQHAAELMSKAEVFGVGMGPSSDSPGEAAIVIYVDRNSSTSIPAEIDGTRTRIVRTDPFQTSGWGKAVQNSCSRN
jgi:hypothetical protein